MRVRATRLFAISGGGKRLALNVFATAAHAYSMRIPANSTYTGSLIRVRRSSDNALLDVGAVATPDANGDRFLDTTALLTFLGANSGFITTWYDQAGTRNYTQASASAQPRIVNAGVLDTFNGKPTLFQNAAGQNLQNATFTKNINTVNAVFNVSASAVSLAGLVSSSNATPIIRRAITQANGWRANPSLNDYPNAATSRINGSIASGTSDGVACVLNPLATPTVATFFPNATAGPMGPLFLFISPSTPTQLFSGSCSEVVYFTDQISDAVRVPLERSQAVAYGISIFDGAAAAYSLRIPFGSNYNGPLARVRRSNDNAELDIGAVSTFDANGNRFIDTAALLAFTGSNSAFVTTLYDQSGNGRNGTQTNAANQPRIVNAGVLDTFNSRPAMFNDGTRWLVTAGISALTTGPVTANNVGAPTTTQSYRYFQSIGDTFAGFQSWTIGAGGANNNFYASAPGIANTSGTLMTANTAFVMTAVHTGSASSGFVNGTASAGTGNSFTYSVGTAPITIGALAAAGTGSAITGYIFEQVYFANTNISTTARQALERNQGAAYGITVA